MILHFNRIPDEKIKIFLEENYQIRINSEIMLDAFQGSIGKALKLQDRLEEYEKIEEIIYNLENKDKIDILKMSEPIYKAKDEKYDILEYMNTVFINLAKKSNKYANCINIVEDTKKRLQSNTNYDMCIDNMLLNLWKKVN